ncbi:hypothetical protein [Lachnoclostridium sp.]|uniref:hypothetical protein n=1 Tax=Lachnoclostridium sp. TaxID=2028282 RepID=UPI002896CCDA|nr:hypothetical protein [Lachnoclostridium sp.]
MDNELLNAIGYKKDTIETIGQLLDLLPVRSYTETQAKSKIYELLMNPDYNFESKEDNQ